MLLSKSVNLGLKQSAKSSILFTKQNTNNQQVRHLNVHEYQSQSLFKKYGVKVPNGSVAATPAEAEKIAEALNSQDLVVKAQVLAGGRGLGTFDNGLKGGVQLAHSPRECKSFAEKMIGHKLFTKQTGPEGRLVSKVLIAKRHFLRRESYFAILLDRESKGPVMIGSAQGGVDIEKVAAENPSAIVKEKISLDKGPTPEQTRRLAQALGFEEKLIPDIQNQMNNLYKLFKEKDALLLEVNPFAETSEGEVMCIDAKINFDTNAAYRQKDIMEMEDQTQMDPREVAASKADLNYIGLDGNIGCLVNGAGLAMATMDMIQLYGGSPANFLDVGGGATQQQVTSAIRILTQDPKVKVILINIFGGIMRCDIIALGLIQAVKELSLKIPLVVRLQGTNMIEAKRVLSDSGLRILTADDLDDAAQKSVKAAEIINIAEGANLNIKFELPL
eukprot:TRINITY_DN926_c0_g1_i1.p1 TRINITY_DN926_c0_g1~~TRINITY_DN926_c0_g1_i1.p1  ORF type:complete len:445 (+),score=130.58 TRINITY_DN926_c0_g1_i1:167-1501(+)